jgi:hypothetical protein
MYALARTLDNSQSFPIFFFGGGGDECVLWLSERACSTKMGVEFEPEQKKNNYSL